VFNNCATGDVVISFNASAASQEGDVGSYMNQMVKQSELINEFRCGRFQTGDALVSVCLCNASTTIAVQIDAS
jgi:hypothetical protein